MTWIATIPRRRKGKPRRGPAGIPADEWRNPKYLAWLRRRGICVACWWHAFAKMISGQFIEECDPCHGPVNGTSQKGPDAGAIPMCRWHHDEQTATTWEKFEAKYKFSRETEAKRWFAEFKRQESKR